MNFLGKVAFTLLVLVALGVARLAASETLTADTPHATPSGATFTAPGGWSITARDNVIILEPPEGDSRMVIADVAASDAAAAIAAAWAAYRPPSQHPLKLAMPQTPRNGWEERRYYEYETSPNERAVVQAMAWRAGTSWTTIIVDATEATFDKRAGPISLVLQSLRPKDYQRESFAGRRSYPLDASRIGALKAFVASGMQQLDIPGVGLSLIDNGRVVYEGGLGAREFGKPEKVDADTLFMAASNTKAMTTLLLAELADENKLRWNQPVVEIYPPFRLGDVETTRRVLVKHLVCACTGIPRQDFEWLFGFRRATPASTLASLRTLHPTSKFGEVFQYDNQIAAAAGYIGGLLLEPRREPGAAYDQAMRRRIFAPLGMTKTTFDYTRAQQENYARPHAYDIDGHVARVSMDVNYSAIPIRPAGGLWTSAHDLARYVEMELSHGRLRDGRRLASEKNVMARYEPQVQIGEDVSYGMGLVVDKRWQVSVVHHGGDMFGYKSDMVWLPGYGVGAVILTNADSGEDLRGPFIRRLLEVLFDGKPEAEEQLRVAAIQKKTQITKARERLTVPPGQAASTMLAEHYRSNALGGLDVVRRGERVLFDFGDWRSEVASRTNDDGTTSFITIDPSVDGLEFAVSDSDGKRAVILRDSQHEYRFVETGAH